MEVSSSQKYVNELRECNDLDPGAFRQVQCHYKEKFKIHVRYLPLLLRKNWKLLLHTKMACELRVFHGSDLRSFVQVEKKNHNYTK